MALNAPKEDNKFLLAVLLASHNRCELTVRAISSLVAALPENWKVKIYHVDDGSTDGTIAAVQNLGVDIKTILGPGDWYWAHSMFRAQASIDAEYNALLWLNDDVHLNIDSFSYIQKNLDRHANSILVGQFKDPDSNVGTYGGYKRISRNPLKFRQVFSGSEVEVDTFNGNFVFISRPLVNEIGLIDGGFAHAFADCDYGLRAKNLGIKSVLIPGFVGTCKRDSDANSIKFLNRIKFHFSTKKNPLKSQIRFLSRHGGFEWPIYLFIPIIRIYLEVVQMRLDNIFNRMIFRREAN
jgi:GT2 family glycosyltransferase